MAKRKSTTLTDFFSGDSKRPKEKAFQVCSKWGAVVDSKWASECEKASEDVRRTLLELRYLKAKKQPLFSPCFNKGYSSVFEQAFRLPGTGVFGMDQIRPNQFGNFDRAKRLAHICHENLRFVLESFVQAQCKDLAALVSLDELVTTVKSLLQLNGDSFRLLSALFYSKQWWVSCKHLLSFWELDSLGLDETAVYRLCQGMSSDIMCTIPEDLTDSLDLLSTVNRDQLISCGKLGLKQGTDKHAAMEKVARLGLQFAKSVIDQIANPSVRLSRKVHQVLHEVHVWLFASNGYGPEDVRLLLCRHSLGTIRFAGCVQTERGREACEDETMRALMLVEHREGFFDAVRLCNELDVFVLHGDEEGVYLKLHQASSKVMQFASINVQVTPVQRKTLALLIRACLIGCNMFKREKRYEDSVHYLKLLVQSLVNCSEELLPLLCELTLRLAVDQEHLKRKEDSLAVVEDLLIKRRAQVLESQLHPAARTLNRFGEHAIGLVKHCIRLSVPPRRWRLGVPDIANPNEPASITIEIEKEPLPADPSQLCWPGGCGVEQAVLDYFAKQDEYKDWEGSHCENGFVLSLFLLLMWDLVFDASRKSWLPCNVTSSMFIEFPDDVLDGTWTRKSAEAKSAVQSRINEILEKGVSYAQALVQDTWTKHHGVHARGMNWTRFSLEQVLQILSGLSAETIAMICAVFAEHYSIWSGGLPDLMMWKLDPPSVRFIEVKGPGDNLSNRQRAWLQKLQDAGANACVCYVVAK